MKKKFVFISSLILLFTFYAKADVPPELGYSRVSMNLVIETTEDLSDYRFYLDFYGDAREVEINNNGRTIIPPMGGGARYSSGTLWAVPKKSSKRFDEKPANEQSNDPSGSKKANEGAVELVKHRFSADMPWGEKPAEAYYLIKREKNTLTAQRIEEEKTKSNWLPFSVGSGSRTNLVIGGVLLTLAVMLIGFWGFRKVSKKV